MKTMHARFPGFCAQTGAAIRPGDLIDYHGKGRSILRSRASADSSAGAGAPNSNLQLAVNHIEIGGQSFYRNARGKCEDAPCCGCCTI
jgi:hypothetical protein